MKYNEEEIDRLINSVDLLEYASQSFEFEQRGKEYFCNCPKHVDVTPSLSISPDKNLFYCFSCGIGGNIISWIMEFEKLSFDKAVNKVAELTGTDIKSLQQCDAMAFYHLMKKTIENSQKVKVNDVRKLLSEDEFQKFSSEIPEEWIKEGISHEILERYKIKVDNYTNRIVYPIYDADGNLISFKGRTRFEKYKELRIPKYQYYQKIGDLDFFVGMKENLQYVLEKNEVIIFEGIKSGMKLSSFSNCNNWFASETSWLSDEQIILLIKLGIKDVVIAYDNDVTMKKIKDVTSKLRRFVNVFAVFDTKGILGKKEEKLSPVDRGKDVWEELYKERIRL